MGAGAAAVVSLGLGLMSDQRSRVANRDQREARKLQQRREAIKAARVRASGVREARIKRGTAVAQAANQGTASSSGLFGQVGALSTASASQQGYFNATEQVTAQANSALDNASSASSDAATFGAISNIFSQNAQRL